MMMLSSTSWMNVCATHAINVGRPPRIASGRLTNAINANPYAHHMVPTAPVIANATRALNPVPAASLCLGGPLSFRRSMKFCMTAVSACEKVNP